MVMSHSVMSDTVNTDTTIVTVKNTFLEFASLAEDAACDPALRRSSSSPCMSRSSTDAGPEAEGSSAPQWADTEDDEEHDDDEGGVASRGFSGPAPQEGLSDLLQVQGMPSAAAARGPSAKAPAASGRGGGHRGVRPAGRPPAAAGKGAGAGEAALAGTPSRRASICEDWPEGITLMLKNLPTQYTRHMLVELLRSQGFLHHCNRDGSAPMQPVPS
ncbi:unnamed protein product [Prorocentrum cordatum]|uniref:Mei2-like C-terminal RNA recognition motif domain-containing protein n=1 Tax=Prorocentrum cordatum TaxID=2364126 RepID=A0ABN9S7J1_9DINO|nr:unnamed protein product [Polarella glacialis]